MEEAQHLPSGRLTIFPFSWVSVAGAPANYLGKAGFQAGQECSATHVFGKSPRGCVRYFDLRLAPDMFAIPLVGAASLRRSLPSWLKYVSLAGLCASLFSLLISIYPFVNVLNPREYGVKIAGTVLVSNVVAVTFYMLRKRKLAAGEVSRAIGSGPA